MQMMRGSWCLPFRMQHITNNGFVVAIQHPLLCTSNCLQKHFWQWFHFSTDHFKQWQQLLGGSAWFTSILNNNNNSMFWQWQQQQQQQQFAQMLQTLFWTTDEMFSPTPVCGRSFLMVKIWLHKMFWWTFPKNNNALFLTTLSEWQHSWQSTCWCARNSWNLETVSAPSKHDLSRSKLPLGPVHGVLLDQMEHLWVPKILNTQTNWSLRNSNKQGLNWQPQNDNLSIHSYTQTLVGVVAELGWWMIPSFQSNTN